MSLRFRQRISQKRAVKYFSTCIRLSRNTHHQILIVGGGSAGVTVAAQLLKQAPRADIGIIDPASTHHYQPGWTLAGAGLSPLGKFARPMRDVIPAGVALHTAEVSTYHPSSNKVFTSSDDSFTYDYLVVATGLTTRFDYVKGLREALNNEASGVSSIYSFDHVEKLSKDIQSFKGGRAVFAQPSGIIKCAGHVGSKVKMVEKGHLKHINNFRLGCSYYVPEYNAVLERLRVEREVRGLFKLELVEVRNGFAIFKSSIDGHIIEEPFDLLHVTPPMGPSDSISASPLSDISGYVGVDPSTLKHNKYDNIFSLGDISSLPTSKTIAAITGQAPVLVHNLIQSMKGSRLNASYDGYTSCPLLTSDHEVLLAEFKYGLKRQETFAGSIGLDQLVPRSIFYRLKKDLFPRVYFGQMLKGQWFGPRGLVRPTFSD